MISAEFCRTMARYNAWQNRSHIAAASGLSEAERQAERGGFFGSIHGTMNHLLWGDTMWMSRLAGWDAPDERLQQSAQRITRWEDLVAARNIADVGILDWAEAVTDAGLEGELRWYSGSLQAEISKPHWFCVQHFFNHQTHHRGQVHGMLTAAGAMPEDTDLFLMSDEEP